MSRLISVPKQETVENGGGSGKTIAVQGGGEREALNVSKPSEGQQCEYVGRAEQKGRDSGYTHRFQSVEDQVAAIILI